MNVSIVGPEGSGKTTFAANLAKKASCGRPIFFIGKLKGDFKKIELTDFVKLRNAVVIIDDANAFVESVDVYNKNLQLKEPVVMSRHNNVLAIYIFHGFDDAVKYFFRQSRYIFVSNLYRDDNYLKNKFIKGITPQLVGSRKWMFKQFKRY